jgi:SAM-dependent methyltransferase
MAEWFEDEEFWRDMYPFLFHEERVAAAADEVDQLLELTDSDGRHVLDLCCGPGRHAVELARRGYLVTGVDRSPFLLARARERAVASGVQVDWVQADMREYSAKGVFDLALSMFTSFGYFDDPRDDVRVLENVHSSLRSGGVLVIDVAGKEIIAEGFQPARVEAADDGSLLVQRAEIFDSWSRIRNEWIIIRGGRTVSHRFHHTIYSAQELIDRLSSVGFADIRTFGDLSGGDYGPGAQRLIVVAVKRSDQG